VNSADQQTASDPGACEPAAVAGAAPDQETHAQSDFVPTHSGALDSESPAWWPESSDGHCSQSAALFAASQPAPLTVV